VGSALEEIGGAAAQGCWTQAQEVETAGEGTRKAESGWVAIEAVWKKETAEYAKGLSEVRHMATLEQFKKLGELDKKARAAEDMKTAAKLREKLDRKRSKLQSKAKK